MGVGGASQKTAKCCVCQGSSTMPVRQAEACGESCWGCKLEEEVCSEGGGDLGYREAGSGSGEETREEGRETWDVHPELSEEVMVMIRGMSCYLASVSHL